MSCARFYQKLQRDEPLLSSEKNGIGGAKKLHPDPYHYVTKHLQQASRCDHIRVGKSMLKIGRFQCFKMALRASVSFEAML